MRRILLTVFEWMARPSIHTFLPCCPNWFAVEFPLKIDLLAEKPPQSNCYGSRKKFTLGCWFLSIELAVGRRQKSHLLRAKPIEITVSQLDLLLNQSSQADWNRCRFIEFHDWIVLVHTSLFHGGTNSSFLHNQAGDFTNVSRETFSLKNHQTPSTSGSQPTGYSNDWGGLSKKTTFFGNFSQHRGGGSPESQNLFYVNYSPKTP